MYEVFLLLHSMNQIKNIKEVTEPLKEEILKGTVHTIEEMKVWLQVFGYSDAIKDATMRSLTAMRPCAVCEWR